MSDPEVKDLSEAELEDIFDAVATGEDSEKIESVALPEKEKKVAEAQVVAPAVEAKTEMLSVPADEYNQLISTVVKLNDQLGEHGKKFDQAFGKIGGMEDYVRKLQKETPAGEAVVLSDEDMTELSEEFPGISKGMQSILNKALSKIKGSGSQTVDADRLNEVIRPLLEQERQNNSTALAAERQRIKQELYREQVLDAHPDMDDLRKSDDFQSYFTTLPKAVQDAWSPKVIIETLNNYKASKVVKPATPQKDARSEALAAAVNPKGSGPALKGKTEQSLEDAFESGFK